MQKVHRHQLPIVLTLVAFLLTMAWSVADAKPYGGFRSATVGHIDRGTSTMSGEPDQPWIAPRDGTVRSRLSVAQGGSDLRPGSGLAAIWALLRVWMLR